MKKFDLHIHTISTALDSVFSFSIDCLREYVQNSALDAIAITNHNIFDSEQFRCIQEEIEDYAVVFPGIEISIGQNSGHMIVISNPDSLEDFAARCEKVADYISEEGDALSLEKFIEIFSDLQKYLLIPHYEKTRAVDKSILAALKSNIFCGEVGSVKKFIYCQKDVDSLTPVYFSDWRASEGMPFPTRHTWLDVEEITIPGIKKALQDKSKVQLSDDEGHHIFQVLPNLKISTGLSIIIGGRSSGKTYTLNQINNVTDRVKYIRQFSLLEQDPQKAEERFGERIAEKQSAVMREYYQPFINVVDEVADISLIEDEKSVEKYLSSLLKHAEEIERNDAFSNCALFTESEYTIDKLDNLKDLIAAVEKLLDARVYKEIIEKNIGREQLLGLHKDLVAKYVEEHQLMLKKIWVNDIISNVKRSLQSRTAATRC